MDGQRYYKIHANKGGLDMERDLSFETNNWIVEDPEWSHYSKHICTSEHHWVGYYGDNYFLKYKKPNRSRPEDRWLVSYPNIAEHFYALDWYINGRWDTIFASYKMSEIERFVGMLDFLTPFEFNNKTNSIYPHKLWMLRAKDLVTRTAYEIKRKNGKISFYESTK